MKFQPRRVPTIVYLCLSLLVAVSWSRAQALAADAGALIKVHLPGYSISSLPYIIADEMGFYKQEGIRADFLRIRTGAGIQAMIAGAVDFIDEVGALQGGISTTAAFLQNRKNIAEKLHRATLGGLGYFKSNRDGTVRIMAKYLELSGENAARVYDENTPAFRSDGVISEDFQDRVLDFELKTIGTDKKISRDKLFDFSLVKGAGAK
ncbi:MAG: hypothetical protein ACREQP_15280 [Candidatus Binatia bacterium]